MARVLEFYSGIGGLRYSLEAAGVEATVVEAFEINELANDVYEFNFGHRPNQGNIQRLSISDLESYKADSWLLSPPCQPYTRQGLQKDSADARASSFLQLLDMIPFLSAPPSYIFIENVVGFETSDTRRQLKNVLSSSGFEAQECILNPLQFGIPYSRPRYFCLAKRKPYTFLNPGLCGHSGLSSPSDFFVDHTQDTIPRTRQVGEYLEGSPPHIMEQYLVPSSVIERWGDAFDIVTPDSTRCCCFTKSYSRYAKGTGSILVTDASCYRVFTKEHQDFSNDLPKASLLSAGLRYFSPREVANLHAFPESFGFPVHISTKQRYALLGNSLNIQVVSYLLRYLFSS